LRDIDAYLQLASERKARIKYIFETHFHADFVSGHIDLASATGASIVYGAKTQTGFDVHVATDGEIFRLGGISMEALHTPGHTLEAPSREEFIKAVTEGLDAPPNYVPINAQINKEGYESLEKILHQGLTPLSVAQVKELAAADAVLLDTRPATLFVQGFVPGS